MLCVCGPAVHTLAWRAIDEKTLSVGNTDVHLAMESLILAQNERWRHGLGMQVEREAQACLGGKWRKGE